MLKPGGRFAVSDVVTRGEIPPAVRAERAAVGRAASPARWRRTSTASKLAAAGFGKIDIEPTRIYRVEDARDVPDRQGHRRGCASRRRSTANSCRAFVRATKPAAAALLRTGVLLVRPKLMAAPRLGVFRALPVGVGSALHGGGSRVLGKLAAAARPGLRGLEFGHGSQINIPIAVLIWLMITPDDDEGRFRAPSRMCGRKPAGLLVTLVVNWLVKPFSMALLAWLFFRLVFSRASSRRAEADQYIAGLHHPGGRAVHRDGLRLEPSDRTATRPTRWCRSR